MTIIFVYVQVFHGYALFELRLRRMFSTVRWFNGGGEAVGVRRELALLCRLSSLPVAGGGMADQEPDPASPASPGGADVDKNCSASNSAEDKGSKKDTEEKKTGKKKGSKKGGDKRASQLKEGNPSEEAPSGSTSDKASKKKGAVEPPDQRQSDQKSASAAAQPKPGKIQRFWSNFTGSDKRSSGPIDPGTYTE